MFVEDSIPKIQGVFQISDYGKLQECCSLDESRSTDTILCERIHEGVLLSLFTIVTRRQFQTEYRASLLQLSQRFFDE